MTETVSLEGEVERLKKEVRRLNGIATDRRYMLDAVVMMLGPKGRQVWQMWQDSGLERIHISWGPDAAKLTGEEIAQFHLDLEAAPKTKIESIDGDIERVRFDAPMSQVPQQDVREFVEKLDSAAEESQPTPRMVELARQAAERTRENLEARSEELDLAVEEGLAEGKATAEAILNGSLPAANLTTYRPTDKEAMATLRTFLSRPGPQDYRIEESVKYLDRLVLGEAPTSLLGYPDTPLKAQVRPLSENLSAFDVIGDHFSRKEDSAS